LEAGVAQPQVLASVKYLDKLRAERKLSNSDQDALCFALALHHNMTEAEVMARLNPPARQAPAVVSLPDDPPGMEEVLPKTMSLQAKVMIAMKLKKKGKTLRRQSGAIRGNRRQSAAIGGNRRQSAAMPLIHPLVLCLATYRVSPCKDLTCIFMFIF
jgi:hypothetical protein